MNKPLAKVLLAIWGIIAIMLTGILVYGISYGRKTGEVFDVFRWNSDAVMLQKDKNVSLNNCDKISLNFSSADVVVQTTDESNLRVIQKASSKLREEEKFTINRKDNTILIERGNAPKVFSIFHFGNFQEKIELYVPKNYVKNLDVRLTSGNVIFNSNITLSSVKCTQSSGDFDTNDIINANEITLKTTSGDINAENLQSKAYNIATSSGDVYINSLSGEGQVEVTSGDIEVNYKDISEYSKLKSSSGDIKVSVPKGVSFEFDGQCTSGDIKSNFNLDYKDEKMNEASGKIGNGPYKRISANTTSGDINISEAP